MQVRDKGLWLSSYKDVPEHRRPSVLPSMFPSGRNSGESSENSREVHDNGENMDSECVAKSSKDDAVSPSEIGDDGLLSLPLERCIRILPHDQNTGAFFIAVFQKRSPLPVVQDRELSETTRELSVTRRDKLDDSASTLDEVSKARSSEMISGAGPVDTETNETSLDNEPVQTLEDEVPKDQEAVGAEDAGTEKAGMKRKLQIQGKWKGIDPVILFNDETVINSIKTFYGIDDSFPLYGHLVSRNSDTDSVKRIYYISKSVKDVLELNIAAGQQLKIASVGLKMFERQTSKDGNSSQCRYRISSEGLPLLLPYITKQILLASPVDFKRLLEKKSVKFGDFIDAELNERASNLELGCCVVVLGEAGQPSTVPLQVDSSTIAIGCWRGRSNVNVMVSALDCKDLLERLEVRSQAATAHGIKPLGASKATGASDADMKECAEVV